MPAPLDLPLHCPHFGRCGGCSSLDVPIAEQLAHKQARARDLLAPYLDGLEPVIALPPRTPRHDRMAILYPAQPHPTLQLQLGIYRRGSHELEPVQDCRIQHKALTQLAVRAAEILRELDVSAYDETSHRGLVRAFRARIMPGSRELLCGVVTTHGRFGGRERLGDRLWQAAEGLRDDQGQLLRPVGVVLNENPTAGNALLGTTTTALRGQPFQTDVQGDLRFRVSFGSFYQLNRHSEAVLFRPALQLLGPVAGLRVVDGYGGVGTFALRLLQQGAAHVTIVENSPSSAADARHNLVQNGFAARGEVHEVPFGSAPLPPCDLLVADPPRAGLLDAGTAAVLAAAPPRVLLVSCSLEALARDLQRLVGAYRVTALRLCDLFPHTEHVEVLTLLERR